MITVQYTITLFDADNSDDITDRVMGFSCTTSAPFGASGSATATLTLANNDGAFTPNAGGTYGAVDYFAKAILIDAETFENGVAVKEGGLTVDPVTIFHGLITGFDLNDNGLNSTVTLTCDDWLAVGGRSRVTQPTLATGTDVGIASFPYAGATTQSSLPLLAAADYSVTVKRLNSSTVVPANYRVGAGPEGNAAQILDSEIMPSGPFVYWPYLIRDSLFADEMEYWAAGLNPYLNRDVVSGNWEERQYTFEWTESPSSSGEIGFRELKRGWTIDLLKNRADVTKGNAGIETPVQQSSVSAGSVDAYGESAVTVTETVHELNSDALVAAERWAHRFDTPSFVPRVLTTSLGLLSSSPAGSGVSVHFALSAVRSLWNRFDVTYTPTGAVSARTDRCVAVRRSINATPEDTTITYDLVPYVDATSFVLDSSVLGVLDQNRLG